MRRRLEPLARRIWAGEAGLLGDAVSLGLLPLSLAYGAVVRARNAAYDRGWLRARRVGAPVISVGNLLVGGTGKTPVSAWVARLLADAGHRPALAARGYGEDELSLHRRWNPDVPVVSGADRAQVAAGAASEGRSAIVLDDGFQHRRLARDLDLVLLPVEGPWEVRLLPRGPYREPLSALERADRAVLTRRTGSEDDAANAEGELRRRFPELPVDRIRLGVRDWANLAGEPSEGPGGPALVVTGIARPRAAAEMVARATGAAVELAAFPDHHGFTRADVARIRERAGTRTVVTTEKDAVRLAPFADELSGALVLRLEVAPESGDDALREAILDAAGRPQ